MAIVPHRKRLHDPDLRDRLYELLEHDQQGHAAGARFVRLIVLVIALDVSAVTLASVPEVNARWGAWLMGVKIAALALFALEYAARLWTVAGHIPRKSSPLEERFGYAVSGLGIVDLLAFLPASIAVSTGHPQALAVLIALPFFKLIRYSPAMRSLLAAIHGERRTLVGCFVILSGAVLLFGSLLYGIERDVQPDKFGTIPDAMWWAIVTLGTVGYGDVVPVTPLGKFVSVFTIVAGLAMIALPVAIISTAFAEEIKRRDFVVTWGMLAKVPLFARLSATEIADIMRLLRSQTIEAGEVLVRRGEQAHSMYFITAGEVEIELPSQHVRLSDGTFFGEIALLRRTRRSGTVMAKRKTRLLVLDAGDFHALIERMPALASHVRKTAEARLADAGDLAAAELAQAEPESEQAER